VPVARGVDQVRRHHAQARGRLRVEELEHVVHQPDARHGPHVHLVGHARDRGGPLERNVVLHPLGVHAGHHVAAVRRGARPDRKAVRRGELRLAHPAEHELDRHARLHILHAKRILRAYRQSHARMARRRHPRRLRGHGQHAVGLRLESLHASGLQDGYPFDAHRLQRVHVVGCLDRHVDRGSPLELESRTQPAQSRSRLGRLDKALRLGRGRARVGPPARGLALWRRRGVGRTRGQKRTDRDGSERTTDQPSPSNDPSSHQLSSDGSPATPTGARSEDEGRSERRVHARVESARARGRRPADGCVRRRATSADPCTPSSRRRTASPKTCIPRATSARSAS
jgi:hypothetical protein